MPRKQPINLDKPGRYQGPRSRAPRIIFLVALLTVSPVLYEVGLICYGNWQSLLGSHYTPKTPILDAASDAYRTSQFEAGRRIKPMLHLGHWQPSMAVPLAIAFAGLGVVMLRKGH